MKRLPSYKKTTHVLDLLVSFFVLVTALVLVMYMGVSILHGIISFIPSIKILLFPGEHAREVINNANADLLHSVVFIIVLLKAYRILIDYACTHHLSIKFMMEIIIIATSVEVVFSSDSYSPIVLAVFVVFGLGNLLLYLIYNDKIKEIGEEYNKEHSDS